MDTNVKQAYEAPVIDCFTVVAEAGIAASPVSGSSIESIGEADSGYSSDAFWN